MIWSENDNIIEQMIKASSGELWGHKLEQADHYPILKSALDHVEHRGLLLDIGCGAGDVSRVWGGDYVGVDFNWVIDRVSKICNPSREYVSTKITSDVIKNLTNARVVLMNAFLDVNEAPLELFESFLSFDCEKIIVHRQRLSQDKNAIEYRESYGKSIIPASIISFNELESLIKRYNANISVIVNWQNDYYTFIVNKK